MWMVSGTLRFSHKSKRSQGGSHVLMTSRPGFGNALNGLLSLCRGAFGAPLFLQGGRYPYVLCGWALPTPQLGRRV